MDKEKTLKFEVPIFTRGMIIGKILKNINIKLHLEMKEVNQTNKQNKKMQYKLTYPFYKKLYKIAETNKNQEKQQEPKGYFRFVI